MTTSDDYEIQVRRDCDGRWDWVIRTTYNEQVIAQCMKQIAFDARPRSRKRAVKAARRRLAAIKAQNAAQWETVPSEKE